METPTSLVIGQLANWLRGLTQRLDPGAGWYGEFLRRDPEGMRACLEGVAVPPWDVVDSLLADLAGRAGAAGAGAVAREAEYGARLRAAAVAARDATPDGARELPALLAAAVEQRAVSEAAVRTLTERLGAGVDPAEAAALARELSWSRDDAARAAARHADLTARVYAPTPLRTPAPRPRPATTTAATWPAEPGTAAGADRAAAEPLPAVPRPREARGRTPESAGSATPPETPIAPGGMPVGRADGWRARGGARRSGGARYAGAASAQPPPFTPPPGQAAGPVAPAPGGTLPAPRGARYGAPDAGSGAPDPRAAAASGAPAPDAGAAPGAGEAPVAVFVARLIDLRARGRGGEAHALLCEAAGWPAPLLPALAAGLGRAGLASDWATLLWEAASLPPARLAEVAAALGDAGRDADCGRLLRQGVARPAAEVADAALALGVAGREREAHALLGAFVGLRTAEEAAALARRDPGWFVPRLLHAARSQPGTRHRDLAHALRVAGLPGA
ncbi:hypothetical protein [Streptomyces sp. NPDC054865]